MHHLKHHYLIKHAENKSLHSHQQSQDQLLDKSRGTSATNGNKTPVNGHNTHSHATLTVKHNMVVTAATANRRFFISHRSIHEDLYCKVRQFLFTFCINKQFSVCSSYIYIQHSEKNQICSLTLLSKVLSFTKLSSASLTRDKSFLAAVTIETMTSWRMASSGSCDLTLKYSGKENRNK